MKPRTQRLLWGGVLLAGLLPALRLIYGGGRWLRGDLGALGANPVETATHTTGAWALYLLLATLLITPLRRLLHLGWLLRFRRLLGLLSFAYASLHFLIWCGERLAPESSTSSPAAGSLSTELAERPFITLGFLAFLLLLPLAATSTQGMIRRLGRRWQMLHRLVYASALLAVMHFAWLVKASLRRPLVCGALLLLLLGVRLVYWMRDFSHDLAPPRDPPPS